jgi:hypothetical protein
MHRAPLRARLPRPRPRPRPRPPAVPAPGPIGVAGEHAVDAAAVGTITEGDEAPRERMPTSTHITQHRHT